MQNYMQNSTTKYINNTIPQAPQVQTPPQPAYSGVQISIYNPMVNPNTGAVVYPAQTTSAYDNAGNNGGCYPPTYYTTQPGISPYNYPKNNPNTGFYDNTGKFYPYVKDANGQIGYMDDNGNFVPINDGTSSPKDKSGVDNPIPNGFTDKDGKFRPYVKDANGQIGYYDDNGVFHPVDPNNNPDAMSAGNKENEGADNSTSSTEETNKTSEKSTNTETEKTETQEKTDKSEDSKTGKRKVVRLDNNYIKTLENYLNSQDTAVREMAANDIVARLTEDSSRKENPALQALVNKMLQDPAEKVRAIALSLVESETIEGDELTVKLLKQMQTKNDNNGMDSLQATNALLKMAGKVIEKEVPINETENSNNKKKDGVE